MPQPAPITFFNRHTGQIETEAIYGEGFLRFVYGNPLGHLALHALVKRALFSAWYGRRMDAPASAAKVQPFIAKYGLDAAQFADPVETYRSFNDFFYRKLKPSARPIHADPQSIVFPADGRHLLVPDVTACDHWMVKGQRFELAELLGDAALADEFAHGSALVSRLCPVDYHRFHFPCDGQPSAPVLMDGPLYSVSPLALLQRPGILWQNKRALTRLNDHTLFLEVGATCVGSIVHTSSPGVAVKKGDEKGYFRFGGSCVITLFKAGQVQWDADLLEHSAAGRELYAWMGERCAQRV